MNTQNKIIINLKNQIQKIKTNTTKIIKQQIKSSKIIKTVELALIKASWHILNNLIDKERIGSNQLDNVLAIGNNKTKNGDFSNNESKNCKNMAPVTSHQYSQRPCYKIQEPNEVSKTLIVKEIIFNKDKLFRTTREIIFADSFLFNYTHIYINIYNTYIKRSLYALELLLYDITKFNKIYKKISHKLLNTTSFLLDKLKNLVKINHKSNYLPLDKELLKLLNIFKLKYKNEFTSERLVNISQEYSLSLNKLKKIKYIGSSKIPELKKCKQIKRLNNCSTEEEYDYDTSENEKDTDTDRKKQKKSMIPTASMIPVANGKNESVLTKNNASLPNEQTEVKPKRQYKKRSSLQKAEDREQKQIKSNKREEETLKKTRTRRASETSLGQQQTASNSTDQEFQSNESIIKRQIRMSVLAKYPDFTSDQINSECTRQLQLKSINNNSIISRINSIENSNSTKIENQTDNHQKRRSSESDAKIINQIPQSSNSIGSISSEEIERQRAEEMEQDGEVEIENKTDSEINAETDKEQKLTGEPYRVKNKENTEDTPLVLTDLSTTEHPATMTQIETPEDPVHLKKSSKAKQVINRQNKSNKKLIQDMNEEEINELNDEFQNKYPIKIHGITLSSDNLHDKKWDDYETICNEIEKQTGVGKYSIVEACVVHDTIRNTSKLTIKVDDYEEFQIIRSVRNWPQNSFGGTILSIKQIPYSFFNNNFEVFFDLVITVGAKTSITSNKLKQCEETYHLTDMERIMNSSDGKTSVPTNRYRMRALHTLAYVSACNNGIVLCGIKYMPEISVNHASICSVCFHLNCRASKKKMCQSKPRCGKCNETGHEEPVCKGKEFCINCQKSHRAAYDGHCKLLQQKTFDNNIFLIKLAIGEGIKTSKYALLRNAAVAIANAEKEEIASSKEEQSELIKEIVDQYAHEKLMPRVVKLEKSQSELNLRMENTEAAVNVLQTKQQEHTVMLENVQTSVNKMASIQSSNSTAINQTNTMVSSIAEMLGKLTAHLPSSSGPPTPPSAH